MKRWIVFFTLIFWHGLSTTLCADVKWKDKLNIIEQIIDAKAIYVMDRVDHWTCVAGGLKERKAVHLARFEELLLKKKSAKDYLKPEQGFLNKMHQEGNLFLHFRSKNLDYYHFSMQQNEADWHYILEKPQCSFSFPKEAKVSRDLLNLCRNQKVLIQLSKGELSPKDYRFSAEEFTLLMKLWPEKWSDKLVDYALKDTHYNSFEVSSYYARMISDGLKHEQGFIEKYPVLRGVDLETCYYSEFISHEHELVTELINASKLELLIALKDDKELRPREWLLVCEVISGKILLTKGGTSNKHLQLIRNLIKKSKDLMLLKAYMQRVERRQSVADVLVLGEFLQSDLYLKGTQEIQKVILDQCAKRKENEMVWMLADSIALSRTTKEEITRADYNKERAKEIMILFTKKDLGDDPKVWKKWYRDQ